MAVLETKPFRATRSDAQRSLGTSVRAQNVALYILVTVALLVLLRYAEAVFVPFIFSLLIAFALNPFVNLLERLQVHRTIAAVLAVVALILSTTYGAYALRNQATAVLDGIPTAFGKVRAQIENYRQTHNLAPNPIDKIKEAAQEIEKTASAATDSPPEKGVTKVQIDQPVFRVSDYILSRSIGAVSLARDGVLVAFLVFFLLASGDLFKRKLLRIIGTSLSEKRLTLETLNEITSQIERFLVVQALTCIAVGVCCAVALWAVGVNQPAFWGALAGVLSCVPYLGPMFVTVALAVVAFVQFDSISMAAKIIVIPIAIFSLEGLLVKPMVMGKAARINGAAMFVSLLFWNWIWGLIGLIVAVPIMMVIKSVCDRIDSLRPISELLDDH